MAKRGAAIQGRQTNKAEQRAYQDEGVKAVLAALKKRLRTLYVLPSGTGKTHVGVRVIRHLIRQRRRALILVHRSTILEQTYLRLLGGGFPESEIGVIWGKDHRANPEARVQLASIDTLVRREWPKADLIVVDEAHHAVAPTYRKVLDGYPRARVLGLTATPCRLDEKPLGDVFDELIVGPTPGQLIDLGYLAQAEVWTKPGDPIDLRAVRRQRGDFDPRALEHIMSGRTIQGDHVAHYLEHGKCRPAVCRAATVDHGKRIVRSFQSAGITAEILTAHTPPVERMAMIGPRGRLATGKTKVVVTCDVLSEGWDLPAAKVFIDACPTLSLTRWLQGVARVLRPHRGRTPVLLDHAGNCLRLGLLPHHTIDWSLERRVRRTVTGVRVAPDGRLVDRDPVAIDGKLVRADEAEILDRFRCTKILPSGERCSARLHKSVWCPCFVAARRGDPPRCRSCAYKGRVISPERRLEKTLTAEQLRDRYRCTEILPSGDRCSAPIHKSAWQAAFIAIRRNAPPRCATCAARAKASVITSFTPEQRSEVARKRWASLTLEQRSQRGRKIAASHAKRTHKERGETSRKLRAAIAAKPAKQRTVARLKGWETRRKRKAASEGQAQSTPNKES